MDCKYSIEIYWSDVDMCYVACIPQIHELFAHGKSAKKALARLLKQYKFFVWEVAEMPEPLKSNKCWCNHG